MRIRIWRGILLLGISTPAWGEVLERVVWGEVTQVQPITQTSSSAPDVDCAGPKPIEPQLAELLTWDLHANCRPTTRSNVQGYRVSYRWDGRSYTVNMINQPGDRIPLRLRLR